MSKRVLVVVLATVFTVLGTSTVFAASMDYLGTTTSTNCLSGRVCVNRKTVNSCGGTSNSCAYFNSNGGASDFAQIGDLGACCGTWKTNGERIFNRNSGTQRYVCGYELVNFSGQSRKATYNGTTSAGWTSMPFTGVESMWTFPIGTPSTVGCGV
jgi:hypothetical protein